VVVAAAPDVAAKLHYEPALPQHHIDFGQMIKQWDDPPLQIVFVFKSDFWNKRGKGMNAFPAPLAPEATVGRCVYGPVFDLSERPNRRNTCGLIRILVQSRRVKNDDGTMWSDEQIRDSALRYLNTILVGSDDAPIDPELAEGRVCRHCKCINASLTY
jgi:hypothetical protein